MAARSGLWECTVEKTDVGGGRPPFGTEPLREAVDGLLLARHAADDREALTALLANMATVENVFDDACRDLTRPAIAARLEAATGRAPSPREVEILFDIFDASHNDKISLREARSALHRGDAHPLIT